MGQRGPRPLPKNVHLLHGNPSKLTASQLRDSISPVVEIPKPPLHLKGAALKEWKRVSVELQKLGLISQIDRAALSMYCTAWGRYCEAESILLMAGPKGMVTETPNGFEVQSAWLNISNKAMEQCIKYLAEFGMSPAARTRVTPSDVQPDLFEGTADEKPSIGSMMK